MDPDIDKIEETERYLYLVTRDSAIYKRLDSLTSLVDNLYIYLGATMSLFLLALILYVYALVRVRNLRKRLDTIMTFRP